MPGLKFPIVGKLGSQGEQGEPSTDTSLELQGAYDGETLDLQGAYGGSLTLQNGLPEGA